MNEENILALKATVLGIISVLTTLWGWMGWLVLTWVILMAADWIIGSVLASKDGKWSSRKLREGAWHKAGMVLIFLIALVADLLIRMTISHIPMVELPFTYTVLLSPLVVIWYIVGELGSLAEHAVATGAPIPKWLLHILEAGRKAVDVAGEQLADSAETEREDQNDGK